jgi:hypothetical protein
MTLTPAFMAASATLFAAGIAATVSLVVTVLSKEQKTSEFRQQWIDALRADIAEWLAETALLYRLTVHLTGKGQEADDRAVEQRFANLVKVRMLRIRIELRLNPNEHTEMFDVIKALCVTPPKADKAVLNERIAAVAAASQKILKAEWSRVKKGELAFVVTKFIAVGLLVAALATAAVLVARAW